MKKMKKLILTLSVAALAVAPLTPAFAEEAAAAAEAKPKKKLQMKTYMNQFEKAKADAVKNEAPILVFVILDGDEKSALLRRYLFNNKVFKQFTQENCSTLILKGRKAAKGNVVDKKSFAKNWDFIEKNIMAEGKTGVSDTADGLHFYPGAFIVSPDGGKKLADLPKYNPELGFGAWAMDVVAKMEQAGVTACVSPELKKMIENPQPDIKMPKGKKK